MAYQLTGRALPRDFNDDTLGRCIFCGDEVRHINGHAGANLALLVNALHVNDQLEREDFPYYYCAVPCPQQRADRIYEESVWRCGCIQGYIENVGENCAHCRNPRDKAVPLDGQTADRVWVIEGRIISKHLPSDTHRHEIEEKLNAVLPHYMDICIDPDGRSVPAATYEVSANWFHKPTPRRWR